MSRMGPVVAAAFVMFPVGVLALASLGGRLGVAGIGILIVLFLIMIVGHDQAG